MVSEGVDKYYFGDVKQKSKNAAESSSPLMANK